MRWLHGALIGIALAAGSALFPGLAAAEAWSGTLVVEATFSGPGASAERDKELDKYAKSLESRLQALRARLRDATGVQARILERDVGQVEGELESIALDRGGSVSLGRKTYVVSGQRLAVDADEGRILVDREAGTATIIRGSERTSVKLAPIPPAVTPASVSVGPDAFGSATEQATIDIAGEPAQVIWAASLPNIYAQERLDSQSRSRLQSALAELPGLPIEVDIHHKGGRLHWRVISCTPGAVSPTAFTD
jgi:hypothetical protein